jgi:apolipoprotein N-acyltransferase
MQHHLKNRLTWILVCVIAFDFGITLLGQPSSYWHDPRTANEGNPVFAWFMVHGIAPYLAFIVIYIASVVSLIRRLPGQSAIITGLIFLFSHYFAGCTWLDFHFRLNMFGPIVYAAVLSMALFAVLRSGPTVGCSKLEASRDQAR